MENHLSFLNNYTKNFWVLRFLNLLPNKPKKILFTAKKKIPKPFFLLKIVKVKEMSNICYFEVEWGVIYENL